MTVALADALQTFKDRWTKQEGYAPAPFQMAIALQRLRRGESVEQIIAALIAQRV